MDKIRSVAVVVECASGPGYDVTHSVYCVGDRAPSKVERYEALDHREMKELVDTLLHWVRPGWEYGGTIAQPPLDGI